MCGLPAFTATVKKELHQHNPESQFILTPCDLHNLVYIYAAVPNGWVSLTWAQLLLPQRELQDPEETSVISVSYIKIKKKINPKIFFFQPRQMWHPATSDCNQTVQVCQLCWKFCEVSATLESACNICGFMWKLCPIENECECTALGKMWICKYICIDTEEKCPL